MAKSLSKTPAPKKDRIYGSKVNKEGSASSEKSAKGIKLSADIIVSLTKKLKEFKETHKTKKVSLSDLKAVYRRGLGAYSSTHRPTISGGKPNTRNAWAMARVNAFLRKAGGGEAKKSYVQDDDLLYELGGIYHGSRYLFDKFSNEKIGSGIGQQQDGWGIYLTDDKDSSKYYGQYIYETTLFKDKDSNEYNFIDLDKPVKKVLVNKIIKSLNNNLEKSNKYNELKEFDYKGFLFYKTLSRILGGDKKASLYLLDNGIDGLKRSFKGHSGKVYRNDYVIFDENAITIENKEKIANHYYADGGFISSIEQSILNLKNNGIVLSSGDITLICYNTGNHKRHSALYNQNLIYKVVSNIDKDLASKIIVNFNDGIYEQFDEDKIGEYNKSKNLILMNQNEVLYNSSNPDIRYDGGGEVKSFYRWYMDWYKTIKDEITLMVSLPNKLQPFLEKKVVIIDKFKKDRESINAHRYLQEFIDKADEFGITIYLEPKPIGDVKTKSELINYYTKFGFELTPNKQFMKRVPKYAKGGEVDSFFDWYINWYKPLCNKINVMISIPNEVSGLKSIPIEEDNVVIIDLFEKIDQSVDAKPCLQSILDKADEFGITIYLFPEPRYNYIKDDRHRKKITRQYLIDYYKKFGFQLTKDKEFMKRLPKYKDGGYLRELKDSQPQIKIEKQNLSGIVDAYFKLGSANAHLQYFGEPMGIEGIPNWAKKEYYLENIYRDDYVNTKKDKYSEKKGEGIILFQKILENAKKNKIDIITLKRAEYSGQALHDYYKRLGFVDVGYEEPLGMYLDLRTDEPFKKVEKIVEETINKYKDGGEVDKNKETYKKWKSLVNMSYSELKRFYESEEGKQAGLKPSEAKAQGIDSGRESARWIMKMKKTPVSEWTPQMWKWANKQISFISRMSGGRGELYDDKGRKTRKYLSLLIWGNDPKKMSNGGEIPYSDIDFDEAVRQFKIAYPIGDDRYLTSNERRSQSIKSFYATKRLEKLIGFDMGNLPNLTDNQKKIRNRIYDLLRENRYDGGGEIPENILEILKERKEILNKSNEASKKLIEISNQDERPMGLVSEKIRNSKEFIEAKKEYDIAFNKERDFNSSEKGKTLQKYMQKLDRMERMKLMKDSYANGGESDYEYFIAICNYTGYLPNMRDNETEKHYKLSDAFDTLFDYMKSEEGLSYMPREGCFFSIERLYLKGNEQVGKVMYKITGKDALKLHNKGMLENGGTINQSINTNIMDEIKFNQLPHIDTINNNDKILIHESVFAGNLDNPKHIGERYIQCQVMGKGGMINSLNLKVLNSVGANALKVGQVITRPVSNVLTKGRKLIVEPIANVMPSFKQGGLNPDNKEVKQYFAHDSGNAGGVLVGKRHSEGGIKAVNKSTGQPLEMEGGEVVITRGAVSNPKKYQFQGKELTTREILSKLNVDGGGVSFAEGGDVPDKMNCGCDKMDFGGTTMSVQDFVHRSDNEYQEQRLKAGIQKERNDHYDTLSKLNAGTITIDQALREIAQKEMKLDAKYPFAE